MNFQDLNLIEPLLRATQSTGYSEPTPIQAQAIPHVLAGRDMIGCAQTGTGKTAAFALPILQHLAEPTRVRQRGMIRALVLSPTRELATQIADNFNNYSRFMRMKTLVIFGGVSQVPQVRALRSGTDILVATPGRLLDLMGQGYVHLNAVEIFVLDEADRMFDMGFIHDVRRIISAIPAKRQTLMFSATMPPDIQALAETTLTNPVRVEVTPQATTVEKIEQSVFFVEKQDKRALLEHLLGDATVKRALVFTRTKHGANKLADQLDRARIGAEAIHGDKSQGARERALSNFKTGRTRVLIATDIASRGIDVDGVTHVINYDLPNEPESYVHRIGRTARAGASGIAFSFCDVEERPYLRDIEKVTRQRVPVVTEHPYMSPLGIPAPRSGNHNSGRFNQERREERRFQREIEANTEWQPERPSEGRSRTAPRNFDRRNDGPTNRPQERGGYGPRREGSSNGSNSNANSASPAQANGERSGGERNYAQPQRSTTPSNGNAGGNTPNSGSKFPRRRFNRDGRQSERN